MQSKTPEIASPVSEILQGLKAAEKFIPSKFFYDSEGSRIFQDIMSMPEYYLTNSEAEIFENHGAEIVSMFCNGHCNIDLVELGAGDGVKTRILVSAMIQKEVQFRYIPVDISEEAVVQLAGAMKQEFSSLELVPKIGDYFHMIKNLSSEFPNRKVIMFLGSNLGNFSPRESIDLLSQLNRAMSDDDLLFIGLDLKKDPEVIRNAYNDPHGHTRNFNLNLLNRMNREFGANFDLEGFRHSPTYDPSSGVAKSFLESTREQEVYLAGLDESISFGKNEYIYTEMSQKYDTEMINSLAEASGFRVIQNLSDSKEYFSNSLWAKL